MSRLDFCKYELVGDCYDWKNDNCDECNIFKAYCEGERRAKNSIVRCKDCRYFKKIVERSDSGLCHRDLVASAWKENGYCSRGERREESEVEE